MKIQAYYTKELAAMYFPNSTTRAATTQLKRWIQRNQELKDALHSANYEASQRIWTPMQVELLFQYLGEP